LEGANLTRAKLDGAVFSGAKLNGCKLLAYSISFGQVPINLASSSFAPKGKISRPKIDERDPFTATATYRALKRHFVTEGDYESASWASYCESLMKRKRLWRERKWFRSIGSAFFGAICGYGEKPIRVLVCDVAVIVVFAGLYKFLNAIPHPVVTGATTPVRALYFSAATFSAYSFADEIPRESGWVRLLISSESLIGVMLLGLFLFTLTKRYVMR
jgi:hypothetical protein